MGGFKVGGLGLVGWVGWLVGRPNRRLHVRYVRSSGLVGGSTKTA